MVDYPYLCEPDKSKKAGFHVSAGVGFSDKWTVTNDYREYK
jgi:hypothetical protein